MLGLTGRPFELLAGTQDRSGHPSGTLELERQYHGEPHGGACPPSRCVDEHSWLCLGLLAEYLANN